MRYYLDTNILIFSLFKEDEISNDVYALIKGSSCLLYVSSVAVKEVIQLHKKRKVSDRRYKSAMDVLQAIEEAGIEIVPMNKHHLLQYAELETIAGHKDPNDHIIIAQAISDKIPIISSDQKFKEYIPQGLNFIFNKR
jgi:PIN domain nuclease of toxin-antitoxin system